MPRDALKIFSITHPANPAMEKKTIYNPDACSDFDKEFCLKQKATNILHTPASVNTGSSEKLKYARNHRVI
jgi:hypothetical protein